MKKIFNTTLVFLVSVLSVNAQGGNCTAYGTYAGGGGDFNSSFGKWAGDAVTGYYNVFVGTYAGRVTSGSSNTFIGHRAGYSNTSGYFNYFSGVDAGYSNTTGHQNQFNGLQAGYSNTTGYVNLFIGQNSGNQNTTGSYNQFIGVGAGGSNTTGWNSLFIGYSSGTNNTNGIKNHFIGYESGRNSTSGDLNYFNGFQSGFFNSTGSNNSFSGYQTGYNNVGGNSNHFFGFQAGYNNTTGNDNYFSGYQAGFSNVSGTGNLFIGYHSGYYETSSNKLYIDNSSTSAPLIYGDFSTNMLTLNGNVGVGVNPSYVFQVQNAYCDGYTWYNVSDKNLKENFARLKQEESILAKVMELPIQYWNYKGERFNKHIGPTAQDFYKAFNLGSNEKAISTIDESGIALAAIQELNRKTEQLAQLVKEQQQLITSLLQSKASQSENNSRSQEKGLKIYQNQPNPFQRDTKITMEIPQEVNQAILYVYDLQGKAIEQQVIRGRGTTSTIIEGGKLSSGLYLYTLIGDGNATEVKRMILTD